MMKGKKKRVFVAMSGGVDSSVSALLLKKRGYEVTGVFIHSYNLDGCEERDSSDARLVCEELNIPFYVFDFEKEYKREVFDYMVNTYKKGLTPNPDVICNKAIKFGLFFKKSVSLGADFIATGHYAFLKKDKKGIYHLYPGKDKNKDQSYFLWQIDRKIFSRVLFPVGILRKEEVRKIARDANIKTANKKDSQGICFLGEVNLFDFLTKNIPENKGKIITTSGEVVGEHKGLYFYTIGQRHLRTNINYKSEKRPAFYVADKDFKRNILILAEGKDNPALFRKKIFLEELNLLNGNLQNFKNPILMRVRYRQPLFEAIIKNIDLEKRTCEAEFLSPQKFIAPGQSAVFYKKSGQNEVLGGGIISNNFF